MEVPMKHEITIHTEFVPGDRVYDKDDPDKKLCVINAIIIKKGGLFLYLLTNGEAKYTFDVAAWPPEVKNNSQNT